MKLKFLFALIILYMLAGIGWFTYSLINKSNEVFLLQMKLLRAGQPNCILHIIEKAKKNTFNGNNINIELSGISLQVDTTILNNYVKNNFNNNYYFKFNRGKYAVIEINTVVKNQYKKSLDTNSKIYLGESLLLILLIGIGIYGIYFSVNLLFEVNKQQTNFLLSVTHEFKTPIASIKLMAQTMIRRKLEAEQQLLLTNQIIDNADRLNELAENMLTAMQIENRKYKYGFEPCSLSELSNDLITLFHSKGEIKSNIQEHIEIIGDKFILRMVISNLIENAFKYSNFKPIEFNLIKKDKIIIEIKDNGIGIPEKYQKKIFKKFFRIQEEETRETKGTGLGLFIVKEAVKKHKGTIEIENNVPNGTIFRIIFPI